jgi:hypothetical protein
MQKMMAREHQKVTCLYPAHFSNARKVAAEQQADGQQSQADDRRQVDQRVQSGRAAEQVRNVCSNKKSVQAGRMREAILQSRTCKEQRGIP